MKPDQERLKNLLTDTVVLLCKNGLQFSKKLCIEGLVGIRVDESDVFFVHISETAPTDDYDMQESDQQESMSDDVSSSVMCDGEPEESSHKLGQVKVKQEEDDDDLFIVEKKDEVFPVQRHVKRSSMNDRVPPLHGGQGYYPKQHNVGPLQQYPQKRHAGHRMPDGSRAAKRLRHGIPVSSGSANGSVNMKQEQTDAKMWGNVVPTNLHRSPVATWPADQNASGVSPDGINSSMAFTGNTADLNNMLAYLSTPRRPALQNEDGRFVCNYPGCTQSFAHRPNLYRHQKYAGHRASKPKITRLVPSAVAPNQPHPVPVQPQPQQSSTSVPPQSISSEEWQQQEQPVTVKEEKDGTSQGHLTESQFITLAMEEQMQQQQQEEQEQQQEQQQQQQRQLDEQQNEEDGGEEQQESVLEQPEDDSSCPESNIYF